MYVRIWCVTLKVYNCVAYIYILYVQTKGSTSAPAVFVTLVKGLSKHLVFRFNVVLLLLAINRRGVPEDVTEIFVGFAFCFGPTSVCFLFIFYNF